MYRSLLVPLDSSSFAEQVLPVALSIARSASAALNPVSVQVPFPPIYGEGHLQNLLEADAREKTRVYLDEVVQRIAAASHFAAIATLLEGPVAETLYQTQGGRDRESS